jgi:hypothetical protein
MVSEEDGWAVGSMATFEMVPSEDHVRRVILRYRPFVEATRIYLPCIAYDSSVASTTRAPVTRTRSATASLRLAPRLPALTTMWENWSAARSS